MDVTKLRNTLTDIIKWRFPDLPVRLAIDGRVYEIGRIRSSNRHVILAGGEEEAWSKQWSQEDALIQLWHACLVNYLAANASGDCPWVC